MRAMVLHKPRRPLELRDIRRPEPGLGQVLLAVQACGVCRTDLHVADGDLPNPKLPLVPGHEIVGTVAGLGADVRGWALGERAGVPWLGWTCGECRYCRTGRCAGLIGYRSLVAAGDAERLGLYGFGAAAHIVAQVARHQGRRVFAFTRAGDTTAQRFALELGAAWAGDSEAAPPEPLDAAIIYAPVGALVPSALRAVVPGGTVVCAGIHMTDIPAFPYQLLWGERVVRSIANLTRRDGEEFLALAPRVPVHTQIESFPLDQANEALNRLRAGAVRGAAVLAVNSPAE